MSSSYAANILKEIDNVHARFAETAVEALPRVNNIHKTVVKEIIMEATVPRFKRNYNDLEKFLGLATLLAVGVIFNRLTNRNVGGEAVYDVMRPEYAAVYACRLVDLMNCEEESLFLEDCLTLGIYQTIREWDLNPNIVEASGYQNTPSGYVRHFKV